MNPNYTCGGEDTVHVSLYCEWEKRYFDHTIEWDVAKEVQRYGKNRDMEEDTRTARFQIEEFDFYVKPHGYNADKEKHAQQAYYHYDLVCNGIRFCFSEREFDEDTPNARVEIGSIPLMIWGYAIAGTWQNGQWN